MVDKSRSQTCRPVFNGQPANPPDNAVEVEFESETYINANS
jgi:hypothetical protein